MSTIIQKRFDFVPNRIAAFANGSTYHAVVTEATR
jgi:hypothetical protein